MRSIRFWGLDERLALENLHDTLLQLHANRNVVFFQKRNRPCCGSAKTVSRTCTLTNIDRCCSTIGSIIVLGTLKTRPSSLGFHCSTRQRPVTIARLHFPQSPVRVRKSNQISPLRHLSPEVAVESEPPGTRTQNPRLKRPLLCQIELGTRRTE